MFLRNDAERIKKEIFNLIEFKEDFQLLVEESQELRIKYEDKKAVIGCADKSMLARGIFLLTKEISQGKCIVDMTQKRRFTECGVMLPLSTNVMKISSMKRYIAHMAALGMNMVMLYMEDTYELTDYPYFGYLRGRYTHEELREIDEYADSMGVEVIPCVQTLAHLQQYLRWPEASPVKDSAEVLMVGNEKTYEFIEYMIKTLKSLFRTDKIHLGMDEARTMGFGKYYIKNGLPNRKQMFIDHISRVKEICKKYELSPRIWSDMIFRVCGGSSDEYAPEAVITPDIIEAVQGVELVYWDYYRTEQKAYDNIIKRHHAINKDVMFAGGVWTWDGFLVNTRYTIDTAVPGLLAALENNVDHILATAWGGDAEDFQDFYCLAVYSEIMYRGPECTEDQICEIGEYLTGIPRETIFAMSELQLGYDGAVSMGKRFVYCDLLYPLFRYEIDYQWAAERYQKALDTMEKDKGTTYVEFKQFTKVLLEICIEKSDLLMNLREQYLAGNKEYIRNVAEVKIPLLLDLYEELETLHEENWLRDYKPFGVEELQLRYGGILARLKFVKKRLEKYLNGEIDGIQELEVKVNKPDNSTWLAPRAHMSTKV